MLRHALLLLALLALPLAAASQEEDALDFVTLSEISFIQVECSDGVDNDGDGRVDFPDDADCVDAEDEAERRPTPLQGQPPRITPLRWPDGAESVRVAMVSGDGRVKTGSLGLSPLGLPLGSVVWEGTRPRVIEDLRPQWTESFGGHSRACGISDDGRYVVGMHSLGEDHDGGTGVYLWDRSADAGPFTRARGRWARKPTRLFAFLGRRSMDSDAALVDLDSPPDARGYADASACDVSNTGIVVGWSHLRAVRWEDGALVPLEPEDTLGSFSTAASITPDGSLTVGSSQLYRSDDPYEFGKAAASRWFGSDTQRQLLSPLDDPRYGETRAWAVSKDGTTIVGSAYVIVPEAFGFRTLGFRWRDGGIALFGQPENESSWDEGTELTQIAADGSLALGSQEHVGALLLAGDRVRSLVDLLENEYGTDLEGWDLSSVRWPALSADGRTIVGNARRADGEMAPFEIRLPPACSDGLDNDGDGRIDHPDDPGCLHPGHDREDRR